MAGISADYSLVGIVIAVSLAIILLSGIALYVAFRIRETFREERGGMLRVAKVAFLIGLLFLSGGVFIFFASGIRPAGSPSTSTTVTTTVTDATSTSGTFTSPTTRTTTTTVTVSSSTSPTSTTSTSSVSSTSSTTSSTTTTSSQTPAVSMVLSYPPSVTAGSNFAFTLTVTNNGPGTANSVNVQAGTLLSSFTLVSSNYLISGNVIEVGDVSPGSVVISLELQAPSRPGQTTGSLSLTYQQMAQPITASFTIRVSQ
jgi:Domain of unknown function DUF11